MHNLVATTFAVTLCLGASSSALAQDLRCRNMDVPDDNPFEEGLGEYGLSDEDSQTTRVSFDGGLLEYVSVGQMSWAAPAEAIATEAGNTRVFRLGPESGAFDVQVRIFPSERGIVLFRDAGAAWRPIAKLDCSSTETVEAASVGDEGVTLKAESEIPAIVLERMYRIDVALEMGDGYYDLIETRVHEVVEDGEIVGYLMWSLLYFTEDEAEVETVVTFDRNGLRLAGPGPEWE